MIKLENVSKVYNPNKSNMVEALKVVNLQVNEGESLAIMGVSGSGKSTLLNIVGCLDTPTSGSYLLDDNDVLSMKDKQLSNLRNSKIGFIIQDNALLENDKVWKNVRVPLFFSKKYKIKEFVSRVNEALKIVGIYDLRNKKVKDLSGGQKQRVAIARAIVNNPQIILADEPTSALDSATATEIIDLLKNLQDNGKIIIVVTHDINVANKMDKIVNIVDGVLLG